MSSVFTPPEANLDVVSSVDHVEFTPAGFWLRVGAFVIDSMIINVVFFIIIAILAVIGLGIYSGMGNSFDGSQPSDAMIITMFILGSLFYIILALAPMVYQVVGWSKYGTTIGKKALRLRVIDKNTGLKPSVAKSIGRAFAYIISAMPFYLGFFWIGWDQDKEGFHDKICQTQVVIDK